VSAPVFVIDGVDLRAGNTVTLDGAEGRHAATVQRLRTGETVVLTDGRGRAATGVVGAVGRDALDVQVSDVSESASPQPRLVVVQALPKGDRGELAVATMTEIGVDEVVPWAADRCIARWEGARGEKALTKWRTTAREAAKQSRRTWFPEVIDLASTDEVAARLRAAAAAIVLHEEAAAALTALELPAAGEVVAVVGPEGGLTPDELDTFIEAGASSYRLGPTVLRTSTAGPAALAVLLSRTARWS
jgi:16S rRNA (uracil1498-N3)-methyltransferase